MTQSSTSQLRNSSRRALTILLQNCTELVICLDSDLCIIELNNAAAKTHNWKRNEILGKNYMKLCLRYGFTNPIAIDPAKILSGKTITHHECTFTHPKLDQVNLTVSWTITRLLNDNKEAYGILMVGTDITDIREAWAQVYNLDSIIKHAPGLIYYWKDQNSVHLGCNDSFAKLAGLKSREEVVGKTDFDLPWKDKAESYQKDDQEVIESRQPKNNIEDTLTVTDGSLRAVVINKVPLRNIIGILATAADITQLKAAEQATLEAKHRAEVANQAKSNFLAAMSHELRTPLNAIMGMAQILQNKNPNKEQEECINIIHNSSMGLLGLINDILDFAESETGNIKISLENTDFYGLLNTIITELQSQFNNPQVELVLDYSDAVAHDLILDPRRTKQVLVNLIHNALKFTQKGEVNIKIEANINTDSMVRVIITDTGIGIPSDKLEHVFERFAQVESQYNRRFEGAGLGLALSKQLTEAMGGSIDASSTVGKGSCFWVDLPIKIPRSSFKTDNTPIIISNPHVLLVEDNILNQKVAEAILKDLGCHIDIASTGKQALELVNKNNYHLIFMDISLPDMDGLTIAREIRKREDKKSSTPIIALTAHALSKDRTNCFNAGMNDVITKPIIVDVLKNILRKWAGKNSRQVRLVKYA